MEGWVKQLYEFIIGMVRPVLMVGSLLACGYLWLTAQSVPEFLQTITATAWAWWFVDRTVQKSKNGANGG